MQLINQVFNFYINSSIHVALAAYALSWVTLIQFNIGYDETSLYFVFYASITGYNFVKYFGVAKFHHRRLATWLKAIQIFSLIAFVFMCYYVLQLNAKAKILVSILGLVTLLYAIPLLPITYLVRDKKNLRQISGLKIYIIALVWSFTTVLVPLFNTSFDINTDVVLTCVQRFLYVLVLMLPFEIRDLNYDNLKLDTIPQKIGVKNTKFIGVLLLILFLMLEFFKDEISSATILSTLVVLFVTLLFLIFSFKNQSRYYSAFWVESLPVVWLLLLLMLT